LFLKPKNGEIIRKLSFSNVKLTNFGNFGRNFAYFCTKNLKKKPFKKADLVKMWVGTRLVPKGVLPTIMVFMLHFVPVVRYITRHNGGSSWVNLTLKGTFVKEEGPLYGDFIWTPKGKISNNNKNLT
jgi:hypothetical protein